MGIIHNYTFLSISFAKVVVGGVGEEFVENDGDRVNLIESPEGLSGGGGDAAISIFGEPLHDMAHVFGTFILQKEHRIF